MWFPNIRIALNRHLANSQAASEIVRRFGRPHERYLLFKHSGTFFCVAFIRDYGSIIRNDSSGASLTADRVVGFRLRPVLCLRSDGRVVHTGNEMTEASLFRPGRNVSVPLEDIRAIAVKSCWGKDDDPRLPVSTFQFGLL